MPGGRPKSPFCCISGLLYEHNCERYMDGMRSPLTLLGAPEAGPLSPISPVAPPFPPCTQRTSIPCIDWVPFGTSPGTACFPSECRDHLPKPLRGFLLPFLWQQPGGVIASSPTWTWFCPWMVCCCGTKIRRPAQSNLSRFVDAAKEYSVPAVSYPTKSWPFYPYWWPPAQIVVDSFAESLSQPLSRCRLLDFFYRSCLTRQAAFDEVRPFLLVSSNIGPSSI